MLSKYAMTYHRGATDKLGVAEKSSSAMVIAVEESYPKTVKECSLRWWGLSYSKASS